MLGLTYNSHISQVEGLLNKAAGDHKELLSTAVSDPKKILTRMCKYPETKKMSIF